MGFFDVVEGLRPIRVFAPKPVEDEKLRQVLEAATASATGGAPSVCDVYVETVREVREALAAATPEAQVLATAPVLLVFCTRPDAEGRNVQETMMACSMALLAATASGLDTAFVGTLNQTAVRTALGMESDVVPVGIMPLGYPEAAASAE